MESRHHTGKTDSAAAEESLPLSPPLQTSGTVSERNRGEIHRNMNANTKVILQSNLGQPSLRSKGLVNIKLAVDLQVCY